MCPHTYCRFRKAHKVCILQCRYCLIGLLLLQKHRQLQILEELLVRFAAIRMTSEGGGGGGGGGVTSTHNKRGCAILTKKVAPRDPGTYLKLRPKNLKTYLKLRRKNPGTRNAMLSFYMRKLTTQIRKSLISTPRFSFTYFIQGLYYLTFVL